MENIKEEYKIVENFIDKDYSRMLAEYFINNMQEEDRELYGTIPLGGNHEFFENDKMVFDFDKEGKILEVAKFAKKFFLENYLISGNLTLSRAHANLMLTGASLGAHKDDPKVQTHVCGIYLNDDYDGGELLFPTLKAEVKPKSGSLLFFRGDQNSHGVKKIESGVRCNVLLYFVESSNN